MLIIGNAAMYAMQWARANLKISLVHNLLYTVLLLKSKKKTVPQENEQVEGSAMRKEE